MIRKLAIALTLVSVGYAGMVQALGLGDAKVNSNLNQPLVAEIDLLSTGGLSDAEILPGLATREEFLKAGIDRVYFLSDIRFEIKKGADGEPKIILTTKKPVREPFLNFLVEIIWPSGRLLREYALLIDPPVYAEDKPVVATPSTVAASPVANEPVAAPIASTEEKGDNLQVRSSVKPKAGPLAGNDTYGKTTSKDTLWDIATGVRPDRSVSPQQVMLAIQDLNPNAFIDNNINKLKAGQILRLPTREQIEARSTSQAINAVIEQNAALRKPKTKTPTSTASKATPAPKKAPVKKAGDELKLVVPERDSKSSDSASSDPAGSSAAGTASNEEINLALEQLDKANLENKDLSDKVGDLEDQLETLQRLLTLKNDQLATLQTQMRTAEMEAAEADGQVEENDLAESDVAQASEQDLVADTAVESEDAATAVTEVVVAETIVDTKLLDADGNVIAEKLEVEETVVVAPVVDAVAANDANNVAPSSLQDQVVAKLMNNPLYQGLAAGILLLLLVLLWLVSKSRAKQELQSRDEGGALEESEANDALELADDESTEASTDEALEDGGSDSEGVQGVAPDAELNSAEDAPESGEDVIAEAEVYIAYGRLDQAAVILEGGIAEDPVRVDYRLKLLEVLRDLVQEDAFDKQFNELSAIQDQSALDRASEMRVELQEKLKEQDSQTAPTDAVDQVEHLLDDDEEQALLKGDDDNFDFDVVEPTVDAEAPVEDVAQDASDVEAYAEEGAEEVAESLDFDSEDLDVDLDIELDLSESDAENELEVDPGIDFDAVDLELDDLDSDMGSEPVADAQVDASGELSVESLGSEVDLDAGNDDGVPSGDLASLEPIDLEAEDLDRDAEIELDLSELALESDDEELAAELGELDAEEEDALSLDLDEELELPLDGEEALSDSLDLDASDLELEDDSLLIDGDDADALGDLAELSSDETADLELDADLDVDGVETHSEPEADVLDLGDDELKITDDTLDEAAQALGDADDFEPELSDDEDFDFLEGTDEASTKLDLARAYLDMEDVDGAREILQEVEQEGSAEQKQQAKDLIESLGK